MQPRGTADPSEKASRQLVEVPEEKSLRRMFWRYRVGQAQVTDGRQCFAMQDRALIDREAGALALNDQTRRKRHAVSE